MWESISRPWQACFEEAWDAYKHGSIPIGAVLIDKEGRIVSRGRNRIHESAAPGPQTCNNRLAHAEVNVLIQMETSSSEDLRECILYTTTEPCVLCFGAAAMAGVRSIRYAATDPVAGGTDLNASHNAFVRSREIVVERGAQWLGDVQRVIRADHVVRRLGHDNAERFLQHYRMDYCEAVALGLRWFESGRLAQAAASHVTIGDIFNEIMEELGYC